ncbi:hypothetical protein TNCV_4440001 [Trichonephila clavipes]|nr:hypothetical protein TNCV_4440001 [Trichonephila clavipes]
MIHPFLANLVQPHFQGYRSETGPIAEPLFCSIRLNSKEEVCTAVYSLTAIGCSKDSCLQVRENNTPFKCCNVTLIASISPSNADCAVPRSSGSSMTLRMESAARPLQPRVRDNDHRCESVKYQDFDGLVSCSVLWYKSDILSSNHTSQSVRDINRGKLDLQRFSNTDSTTDSETFPQSDFQMGLHPFTSIVTYKGSSGNLDNDRADQLAKEATCQDINFLMSVPLSHWKHVALERTVSSWNTEFLASPKALWTKRVFSDYLSTA